jgi:hypothetical protein
MKGNFKKLLSRIKEAWGVLFGHIWREGKTQEAHTGWKAYSAISIALSPQQLKLSPGCPGNTNSQEADQFPRFLRVYGHCHYYGND